MNYLILFFAVDINKIIFNEMGSYDLNEETEGKSLCYFKTGGWKRYFLLMGAMRKDISLKAFW
jgi:hypothetical protein